MDNSSSTRTRVGLNAASADISDLRSQALCISNNQTDGTASRSLISSLSRPQHKSSPQWSKQPCRFFTTQKGCRAGDQCRYQHVLHPEIAISAESGNVPPSLARSTDRDDPEAVTSTPSPPVSRNPTPKTRVVSKPISAAEAENPREFQINQVVRRYSPFRADVGNATTLKFRLLPTDPDFPFELETGLHCLLNVPEGYPKNARPILGIQNPDMPRGFQINVEKGFDQLVTRYPGKNLLALLNDLDKNLEQFLSSEKAATIKLIANRQESVPLPEPKPQNVELIPFVPGVHRYNREQLQSARTRRDAEVRQLEARLGRSEGFSKAGDGVAFNVPLHIADASKAPASLRSLRETALIVPDVYPLEPCTIVLRGVEGEDAENVEVAFEKRTAQRSDLSLMAHINYLTQNLAKLSASPVPKVNNSRDNEELHGVVGEAPNDELAPEGIVDPSRPHIRYMARPPEWETQHDESSDATSDTESSEDEEMTDDELESIAGGAALPTPTAGAIGKGTQLAFPGLALTGIELLHVSKLSISIKCDRCKQTTDVKSLVSIADAPSTMRRSEPCSKCSVSWVVSYRAELMHPKSAKAGHLELENCSVVDLLPSTFQPTCSACSTTFPPPGVTAVTGDAKLEVCRSCHSRMSFSIPESKFLHVSTAASASVLPTRSKKPKEKLGISAGTPLPANGKCQHYSKSYRWFRFSCCNRVFPCDKCHDSPSINPSQKDSPHPNEHADRMICGWCSREQRYHPEICRHCGHSVVKKNVTTGFWEGGKGTRDKALMRKKEGRKYKISGREKKELNKKKVEAKGKGGMWWPE